MTHPKKPLFLLLLLYITLAMLLASSGVLAYTLLKSVAVGIEISPGVKSLDIYAAATPGIPSNSIQIAGLKRGTSHTVDLLVKNTGQETLTARFNIEPPFPDWGTITADPADFTGRLEPGSTQTLSLTVAVPLTTPTGNVSFSLYFYEP